MVDSNQKSVVRQLKQMGLCLSPKRQQRRGDETDDLCWQTVPRQRRSHRKGIDRPSGAPANHGDGLLVVGVIMYLLAPLDNL